MRTVDRRKYCHDFVQDGVQVKVEPYHDAAMPIPYNATISAPHMVRLSSSLYETEYSSARNMLGSCR